MSGKTHAKAGFTAGVIVGSALTGFKVGVSPELVTAIAMSTAGALFPDLDLHRSKGVKLMRKLVPAFFIFLVVVALSIANHKIALTSQLAMRLTADITLLVIALFVRKQPHRGASHSLTLMVLASICICISLGKIASISFAAGYLSHLALDLLNNKGEQLLYPLPNRYCLKICKADGIADVAVGAMSLLVGLVFYVAFVVF